MKHTLFFLFTISLFIPSFTQNQTLSYKEFEFDEEVFFYTSNYTEVSWKFKDGKFRKE